MPFCCWWCRFIRFSNEVLVSCTHLLKLSSWCYPFAVDDVDSSDSQTRCLFLVHFYRSCHHDLHLSWVDFRVFIVSCSLLVCLLLAFSFLFGRWQSALYKWMNEIQHPKRRESRGIWELYTTERLSTPYFARASSILLADLTMWQNTASIWEDDSLISLKRNWNLHGFVPWCETQLIALAESLSTLQGQNQENFLWGCHHLERGGVCEKKKKLWNSYHVWGFTKK